MHNTHKTRITHDDGDFFGKRINKVTVYGILVTLLLLHAKEGPEIFYKMITKKLLKSVCPYLASKFGKLR